MKNLIVEYNKDTDILTVSWSGKTTVGDISKIMIDVIESGIITPKCKKIFSDQREVEYVGNLYNFSELFSMYDKYSEWLKDLKLSVVINSPFLTAAFILFRLKTHQYKIRAFYSEDEAKAWLLKSK